MRRILRLSLPLWLLIAGLVAASSGAGDSPWPLFAFDNGVGRGVWPPAEQAATVKRLGYDGIHYNYTDPADFAAKLAACQAAGVPIHAVYVHSFLNKPGNSYDPKFREVIRLLKGSGTIIWLTLRDGKPGAQDAEAAAIVREVAGLAAEAGLKVSLYPHAGFYVATAEDAVRIARLVNLPHVGVTVNLCHELSAGHAGRLDQVVKTAAPLLNLVSINGAAPLPGKGPKAWSILPLGEGTFDVAAFLRLLKDAGYRGPIGHQFYGIPGDDRDKLARAIRAWRETKPKLLGTVPPSAMPPAAAVSGEYNATLKASMPLEDGWNNPPRIAQTRVWWWWLNGNTDKPTITRELEAMKAAGIGGANIIDAGGDDQRGNRRLPHGPDFGSPAWIELFRHAVAEADRLGLELGFNIQSGWNLGGPAVTPEEAAKKVTFSKREITGGKPVDAVLPMPPVTQGFYRDARVVAVPLSEPPGTRIEKITASSAQSGMAAARAADGDPATFWVSAGKAPGEGPTKDRPEWIELRFSETLSADRVEINPRPGYGPREGLVEAVTATGRRKLTGFTNGGAQPIVITFPPSRMEGVRVVVTAANDPKEAATRNVQIAEISLRDGDRSIAGTAPPSSGGAHLLAQKAYFQYPGPFTAAESWHLLDPGPAQPHDQPVPPAAVVDLTDNMDAGGRLRWTAPPGRWEVMRFGVTLSGSHVSTHSEGGGGLAIDYLDRAALDRYWQKTLDPIFAAVKPHLGRSLRFLHTDSWELGPVNWTRLMPEEFQRLRGYDITPWLPVLGGHLVGSRERTDRFLNDFRRTLADLMAANKYEGFSEKARALGLGIHPESGGPHAGPMDALRNLGISDVPMGEFWSTSPSHRVRDDQRFFVKQTTSAAHTYGRRVSLAEAFTNIGRHWQHDPRSLKPTFDRAACEGHNLTMWHTFPSSKAEHGLPGAAYFAGEHFNPNITWWEQGKAFLAYLNRCHFLLQQGLSTSDVLHFYGENIPSFVRLKRDDPAKCLPGYDYDVIDARALLHRVTADGRGHAVLPEGTRYRIVSLVPHDAVSLPVLRHLAALVEQGVTLVGPAPRRPFSLTGGEAAEKEFAGLVARLWGEGGKGMKRSGKGRVIWGQTTREVLQADGIPQDFAWTGGDGETHIDFIHRRTDDTQIYFVANRHERREDVVLRFRVTGLVPEIWDPVTGARRDASEFRFTGGVTELPYPMQPEEAFFVIFRKPAQGPRNDAPNVPELVNLTTITGPWEVAFDPAWGGPAAVTFESLSDWTTHADEGIRHYSGAATYRKRFEAPPAASSVFLDLGMVESLCEVRLNGVDLGVWWSFPFRREIAALLRPGINELEVKVVNLWCNRIIGDAALPANKRRTRTNITNLTAKTALEPSGLLGPVRLLVPRVIR